MADEKHFCLASSNAHSQRSFVAGWLVSVGFALTAVCHGLPANSLLAGTPSQVDTVVVCHPAWQTELLPWLHLRREQGHVVEVIPPEPNVLALRQRLQAIHQSSKLRYVVLIGNTRSTEGLPTSQIATDSAPAWQKAFPSDSVYAELTDDDVPDVAIGRIAVQDSHRLREVLDRVIRYETAAPAGPWQQRVEVVGGIGGFGPVIDAAVEKAVQTLLVNGVPNSYRTGMTYASWKSPYCPCLQNFQQQVLQRYNTGCLLWVYAGHGFTNGLDSVGGCPILASQEVHQLQSHIHAPVATLFSCNAGNFGGEYECLAESMLRTSGGPVAIIASAGISMPYGNISLANAMVGRLFANQEATLGECMLESQRELLQPDAPDRQWIDNVAALLGTDAVSRQRERVEHAKLYHLFGDPMLRLRYPTTVQLEAPATASAGDTIQVRFDAPLAGPGTIELVCSRGRFRSATHPRTVQELRISELQSAWDRDHLAANSDAWCRTEKNFVLGTTEFELPIPLEAHGQCQVRLFLTGEKNSVQAAAPIYVRKAVQATQLAD